MTGKSHFSKGVKYHEYSRSLAGKKVITLINKEDLPVAINRTELDALLKEVFCGETLDSTDGKTVSADAKRNTTEPHILTISAKEGQGRDELAALIKEMFLAGAFINAVPGIVLHLIIIPPIVMLLGKAGLNLNGKR